MASIKISELEEVVTLSEGDTLPIINEGDTKQVSITKLGDILATKEYVGTTIAELGDLGFTPIIVESLPTEDIKTNTIYLILNESQSEENIYDEYLYINNAWENIGSTKVDLSEYYTKTEVDEQLAIVNDDGTNVKKYHIYAAQSLLTVMETIGKTTELGSQIMEVMQQIYDDRENHAYACIIWHNTHAQAGAGTISAKVYIKASTGADLQIDTLSGGSAITEFHIMPPTISNGVLSWSNDYVATVYQSSLLTDNSVLTKTNTSSYTPTSNYHPATKKYVDETSTSVVDETISTYHETLATQTFKIPTGGEVTLSGYYTVENISTTYGFELNDSGFYESNNNGVVKSCSLCKVTFNLDYEVNIPITVINSAEAKYDYGIFSEIDTVLEDSYNVDSTGVFKAYSGDSDSSTSEQTLTYTMPAGEHFIYIKYRKDSSGDKNNDSLQFKIPEELVTAELEDFTFASKEYVNSVTSGTNAGGSENPTIIDINTPLISTTVYNQTGQITVGTVDTDIEFIEQLRVAVQLMKDNVLAGKTGSIMLKLNFKPEPYTPITSAHYVRSLLFTLVDAGNGIINETTNPNRMYFRNEEILYGKQITRELFFSTTWDVDDKVTISSDPQMTYTAVTMASTTYVDNAIATAIATALESDY